MTLGKRTRLIAAMTMLFPVAALTEPQTDPLDPAAVPAEPPADVVDASADRADASAKMAEALEELGQSPSVLKQAPAITVNVTDISPSTGSVEISLFNTAENFLKLPYHQKVGPVEGGTRIKTEFGDVPLGEYAIAVVHDANDNGKLDRGFLGFGGESLYAFSNNVQPWFGWPDFEDAKFTVDASGAEVNISLD